MCCDSGVLLRVINVRKNGIIIGLAFSFVRNNHHKIGTCIYREKKRKKSSYHHNY